MRLYEVTSPSVEVLGPEQEYIEKPPQAKWIGGGIEAEAYSTDLEPGTVSKIVKPWAKTLEAGAYYRYLQILLHNDRFTANPYFPKIFGVQVLPEKDQRGPSFKVDMERLFSLYDASALEIKTMCDYMFYDYLPIAAMSFKYKHGHKPTKRDNEKISSLYSADSLSGVMRLIVEPAGQRRVKRRSSEAFLNIKDPYLKQAVIFLRGLTKQPNISTDLHAGNLMVRRTPVGPHLVITDPVV